MLLWIKLLMEFWLHPLQAIMGDKVGKLWADPLLEIVTPLKLASCFWNTLYVNSTAMHMYVDTVFLINLPVIMKVD